MEHWSMTAVSMCGGGDAAFWDARGGVKYVLRPDLFGPPLPRSWIEMVLLDAGGGVKYGAGPALGRAKLMRLCFWT